jgi:hypothetical protein
VPCGRSATLDSSSALDGNGEAVRSRRLFCRKDLRDLFSEPGVSILEAVHFG